MNRPSAGDMLTHRGDRPGADPDLPSGRAFIALLEAFRASGGTAPGEVVGRLLEEHQIGDAVSLAKLIYTGQAFGFEWRANLWIPMFQFDADALSLKAGAQQARAALPPLWSGWKTALWFARPNARLDACSPANVLDADPEAVLHAAQALKPLHASAPPLWHAQEVAVQT